MHRMDFIEWIQLQNLRLRSLSKVGLKFFANKFTTATFSLCLFGQQKRNHLSLQNPPPKATTESQSP